MVPWHHSRGLSNCKYLILYRQGDASKGLVCFPGMSPKISGLESELEELD